MDARKDKKNLRSSRIIDNKSIKNKEDLDKISSTYSGEKNPFYGKKHDAETRELISKNLKGKLKGIKYDDLYGENSEIEKEKRREGVKKSWNYMSEDEYKKRRQNISSSLKGKMTGKNNPFSSRVSVDGIIYDSMTEAIKNFKNEYTMKNIIK